MPEVTVVLTSTGITGTPEPATITRTTRMAKTILIVAMIGCVALFVAASGAQAVEPKTPAASPRMQIVNGSCDPSSHTAEGPLGADLTKRRSRFFCDSAVIMFFDDYKGHVMIQFVQKEAHHAPILGFAGKVDDDGIMVALDHVYLTPGQPTTVSDGWCKFFFKNRHMSGIFCGMAVDETGRRTTASVEFNPLPGQ
jgi:hypothetical protein